MLSSSRQLVRVAFLIMVSSAVVLAQGKKFNVHGTYVEGCSCKIPCACSLNGEMAPSCQLMGAMIISSGDYGDVDLTGARLAFAAGNKWVRLYVQSTDPSKAKAAEELGRALLSPYGKIESVSNAEIDLSGKDGTYTLSVNGGKTVLLKTQPVLGADQKTAVTYTNYPDPLLRTIMQAKTLSGSYSDDMHHFTLENSNSFFNQDLSASGEI